MNVGTHIESITRRLQALAPSTQQRLRRKAAAYVQQYPHMAHASTFWRGLSATQVIAATTTRR